MLGLFFTLSVGPVPPVQVDHIELNRVVHFNHQGQKREVLQQWIIWRQYKPLNQPNGWHVWCWRRTLPHELVQKTPGGSFHLIYRGVPIQARTHSQSETTTDPEIEDLKLFPRHLRAKHIPGWQQ